MYNGLLDLPWWQLILVTLALTHVTIVTVTVYLHRSQAHRALDLHPVLNHFFRFWTWAISGGQAVDWVAEGSGIPWARVWGVPSLSAGRGVT